MIKNTHYYLILLLVSLPFLANSQSSWSEKVQPRMRVIIDNDYAGDPDGLFQLVHHLLSPSIEIRAIIGSHLKPGDGFDSSNETATHAVENVNKVLELMSLQGKYQVYQGSNKPLNDKSTAIESDGAKAIVKEAMRTDTKERLFVVCGGGLTEIASAYLLEPQIADKLTLIWIGGTEHIEMATPPPGYTTMEYNTGIDLAAVQVIFNQSSIDIWQVPRDVYRQALMSYAELKLNVETQGEIGKYLTAKIDNIIDLTTKFNFKIGETYVMGDNPLVLLTALQSSFEADPSSSFYKLKQSPLVNDQGTYEVNYKGRNMRVYNQIDNRLLFEDFYAKLKLFNLKP